LIYLRNSTRKHALNVRALERKARDVLRAAGEPQASLSLSLVGDAAIRRLNREHRRKDRATDVLSFPLLDPSRRSAPARDAPERMLGDVVISLDTAARQAAAYDARLEAELTRLLIHGVLHLLGWDHEKPGERARMEREERRLARAVGMRWPYPGRRPASAEGS